MRALVLFTFCCLILSPGLVMAEGYPWCNNQDRVSALVEGGDLVLRHDRATYNCCPDGFTYNAEITAEFTLLVTELESLTMACDCMCCYNLETTIQGLAAGQWAVVYRWLDNDTWQWRDWRLTVTIEEAGKADLPLAGEVKSSGCLDSSSAPAVADRALTLAQNQPNPFNPSTTIRFQAPGKAHVDLVVFDAAGRLVRTLLSSEPAHEGWNEATWDGRDESGRQVASGTYHYRLTAGDLVQTRPMVLLR